jgi:hypothetical protein
MDKKLQNLVTEFNKAYWETRHIPSPSPEMMESVALLGRQIVVELGRNKIVHDYLLNSEKDPDPFEVKEL